MPDVQDKNKLTALAWEGDRNLKRPSHTRCVCVCIDATTILYVCVILYPWSGVTQGNSPYRLSRNDVEKPP